MSIAPNRGRPGFGGPARVSGCGGVSGVPAVLKALPFVSATKRSCGILPISATAPAIRSMMSLSPWRTSKAGSRHFSPSDF